MSSTPGFSKFVESPNTSDDLVSKKIEAINAEIERKNREAEQLLQYLTKQQELAKFEEEQEEDALKKQGIIVGQHIPSLPSKLNLSPSELAEYETFSSTLLVARDLVQQNRINFLRRTGNLPISDLAETRREANQKYASQQDPDVPHYLEMTTSAKLREDRVSVRFAETIQQTKQNKSPTRGDDTVKAASNGKLRDHKKVISAKERLEHENVLKSINHKLNYLRNPRNNPNAVTKMLVKPKEYFNSIQQPSSQSSPSLSEAHSVHGSEHGSAHGGASAASQKGSVPSQGPASIPNSHHDDSSHIGSSATSVASALKSKYSKFIKLTNNPLFVCEPSTVLFMDFELGKKYTQSISFRNISAVSRTVRILQPKLSSVFSISPLKYPPNCSAGMIAPGMSVSCVLSFVPNALGDFEDFIAVDTEAGSTKVMIKAQREPPNLSIPTSINLGYCLVGDAQRSAFSCMNTGGTGRFTIIEKPSDAEYLHGQYDGNRCLRIPPFTIYPTQFDLQKSESIELIFEFVPLELGPVSRSFAIHCDNGQIREFTVQGRAKEINVSMIEINRVGFDEKDSTVYHDLHFDKVCLGTEMSQNVMVANDTGISVEYEWVWLDANDDTSVGEWHVQGQEYITKRQDEQRPLTVMDSNELDDMAMSIAGGLATDAQVNHNLLRSIKESLTHNTGDGDHGGHDNNVAKREGFEIIPARGVLAGEGAATFKVIYSPTLKPGSTSLRAVMMIKSIPKASLRTIEQEAALDHLRTYGHGRYPRLLSWLEDIGTQASVERYQKSNGSWSTTKSILSLSSIVNLIISHAMDFQHALPFLGDEKEHELAEKHQQEIDRFNRWIRNIIRHVYEFRKKEAMPDDGSLASFNSKLLNSHSRSSAYSTENDRSRSIPTNDSRTMEVIDLYEWFEGDNDQDGNPKVPRVILPVQLYFEEPETGESDAELGHIEEDDDPELREIIDENTDKNRPLPSLREFLPEHREIISEIWVDSNNALMLFGDYIDWLLNEKVQHEAIDYLKESTLNHLASINFKVHGSSHLQHVSVQPPCLEIGGKLSLGKEWSGEVFLTNHTDAPMQLFINCQDLIIKKYLSSTSNNSQGHNSNDLLLSEALMALENIEDQLGDDDQKSISRESSKSNMFKQDIAIYSDYERLLLMPHSSERFVFNLVVNVLGKYQIQLPVVPIDSVAKVENIVLEVNASGPKVRFEIAEVDIGLLGVGGEISHKVSFSNEGDVPIMFMMKPTLHVDNAASNNPVKKIGSFLAAGSSSRPNTHREGGQPLSARSSASRQSSIHSDDFSVADSNATSNNGDFKIELKNAVVTLDPPSGVVEAKSTMSVIVTTKAGKVPQRIRGMLENRIFDAGGKLELTRQFINLRGEVQSPKILLYPMHHNLGSVYIGRTVNFSFTLENICNLPTKFKFIRPGGQSSMYAYSLSPNKGSLEAKEKLTIHGTFTATNTGMVDDIISCKLFGLPKPLGFVLKAFGKGITLEFINAPDDPTSPPVVVKPLANPTDVQLPNNEKPPDPHPIEPMIIGDSVPLYERRSYKFYIRNLSAIAAPFAIQPRKFCVMEKDWKGTLSVASASTTSSFARPARTDLVLAPQEDGANKFQSDAGKKYVGAMVNRREDRKFLKSGFGASYLIDCVQGELPPWGVKEINIYAFNDIPGCYDDIIDVSLFENDVVRKFNLPIKMKVEGCPVVIEKSSLGMTVIQPGDTKHPVEFEGRQLLSLGETCEHGPQLRREFYVRNNGSKVGKIAWTITGLAANKRGPLKVGLRVNPDGTVKTHYRFWSDIAKESPFKIEPMDGLLKPYGKQRFTLTMTRNSPAGMERAELVAKVAMKDEENELEFMSLGSQSADDQSSVGVSSTVPKKPKEKFTLNLLVEGNYVHPRLIVDKHTFTAPFMETHISDTKAIHLKAKATLLFSSGGKMSYACSKLVTITNPLETEIVINTFTEGPYVIRDVQENKDKNKHISSGATIATVSSIGAGEAGTVVTKQSTTQGKPIHMIPHQTSKFMITFNPKKQVREQLLSAFGTETGKPTDSKGHLIFAYPTGQKLFVPIITAISTPYISGSSPRMYFGICHVRHNCNGVFLLSNPTDVPARWTVQHVPGGGKWKNTTAIRVKGFEQEIEEDDPEVFSLTPNNGMVEGPTVSVAATMAAPPKDYNRRVDAAIVSERLVESSWATKTLSIADTLELRHKSQGKSTSTTEALYPAPISITFSPKKNKKYCSRFRFVCEFANSFDVVLQGEGTFEEHEHRPLNPMPR